MPLTIGPFGDKTYISQEPAEDDKQAGQMAAAEAMKDLYPDMYAAAIEAHSAGATGGANPATGEHDPFGEPKSALNQCVQLCTGRPLEKTDITFSTVWSEEVKGYVSTVVLHTLGTQYESNISGCWDQRQSEKSAARVAIAANMEMFQEAKDKHEVKKARDAHKNDRYRPGGKSYQGGKGKGGKGGFPGYR